MRRSSIPLVLLGIVLGITACHSKPNDDAITKDLQQKIAADPATQDSKVAVDSREGNVTLKGTAQTVDAKRRIESLASAEPGVTSVDDQLSVRRDVEFDGGRGEASSDAAPPVAPKAAVKPPPPPAPVVVPMGTILTVRIDQPLSTKTAQTGGTFTGVVVTPITLGGKVAVPQGAQVTGVIMDAKKAGKFKGGASLTLALDSVTVKGHKYNIVTEYFAKEGKGKGKRTAALVGGGTGVGAAIGGLAGGGKGAAIGALAGATAGTVGSMTGNRDIELPSESALTFKLDQSLTLKPGLEGGE